VPGKSRRPSKRVALENRAAERGWRLKEQGGSYQMVDAERGTQAAAD
jgi:hypothetical protein